LPVRTAPGLIGKSKAWEGYDKAERPLRAVVKKLTAWRQG